jgi:LIM domain-binding protein 1
MDPNVLVCFFFLNPNSFFILFRIQGIGRVLIPRFFRTLFDGGVNEVYFQLKQTKESFHSPILSLDCEQASMITCFGKPPYIKVRFNHRFNLSRFFC